jgi:phosphohistidine swiveling domain-containing protein
MPLAELSPEGAIEAGAIAQGLAQALALGLPVVEAHAISARAYRELQRSVLPPGHDVPSLIRIIHRPRGVERAALARERVLTADIDHRLASELTVCLDELAPEAPDGVDAMASPTGATVELGETAGLVARRGPARGSAEVYDAIRETWCTTLDEEVLRFYRSRRLKDVPLAMLLLPSAGERPSGTVIVEPAAPGAPAHLVLFRRLGTRIHAALRLGDGGAVRGAWGAPAGAAERACLSHLHELAVTASEGGACAFDFQSSPDGTLRLTSFRRLTPPSPPRGSSPATRWARTTVGGGLAWRSGTPLSFELDAAAAEARCRRARVAVARPLSKSDGPVIVARGRCFVQSSMLDVSAEDAELPRASLHELGGAQLLAPEAWTPGRPMGLARLGMVAARVVSEVRRLGDAVDRFDRDAEQQRRWLRELDLGILPDDALRTTLREGHEFVASAERLMGECAVAMSVVEAAVSATLARAFPQERRRLAAFVTAGAGDLESAKPSIALCHVAEIARRDPAAPAWLEGGALPAHGGPALRALRQYLDAFGDLTLGDAEISAPRWREAPGFLTGVLRVAVSGPALDVEARLARVRAEAEARWARIAESCSFVEVRLLRELVARLRDLVRLRARLSLRVAHSRSMMRTIVVDVDGRLRRLDARFPELGAFDCRFDELSRAVGSYRADLAPVVELRRASPHRGEMDAPLTFVGGVSPWPALPPDPARAVGIGVSPGQGSGAVRFVDASGPDAQFEPGDVAVVESAGVGLGPLMLVASAVVAEVGNPWSDGSVLARELGVPMVTGVAHSRLVFTEGEPVTVDGATGTVLRSAHR